jgi:hypothetical protein
MIAPAPPSPNPLTDAIHPPEHQLAQLEETYARNPHFMERATHTNGC